MLGLLKRTKLIETVLLCAISICLNFRNKVWIEKKAIETLSHLCDGDARVALNGLQMTIQSQTSKTNQSGQVLHSNLHTQPRNIKTFKQDGTGKVHMLPEESSDKTNGLDGKTNGQSDHVIIKVEHVKEGLQRSHVLYDRAGKYGKCP